VRDIMCPGDGRAVSPSPPRFRFDNHRKLPDRSVLRSSIDLPFEARSVRRRGRPSRSEKSPGLAGHISQYIRLPRIFGVLLQERLGQERPAAREAHPPPELQVLRQRGGCHLALRRSHRIIRTPTRVRHTLRIVLAVPAERAQAGARLQGRLVVVVADERLRDLRVDLALTLSPADSHRILRAVLEAEVSAGS
jgi:hypothetical protein